MEKKKSPGAISLGGFVLGVAGIIVSMVGMHRLYYAGEILSMPTSLFLLYLGYAITVVGSVLWTLGVLKGWDDSADKKGCVGLRVFGALPFVTGIITVLGGVRDKSGRIISLVAGSDKEFMGSKSFLLLLGAIIAVVGLVIWGISNGNSSSSVAEIVFNNNTLLCLYLVISFSWLLL